MRNLIFALGVLGALAVVTDTAMARDGCGRGYYWNGYACVQEYYAPPPPTYYQPQPYYQAQPYYQPQPQYGYGYRQPHSCPPNWEWNPKYGKCTSNYR